MKYHSISFIVCDFNKKDIITEEFLIYVGLEEMRVSRHGSVYWDTSVMVVFLCYISVRILFMPRMCGLQTAAVGNSLCT